MERETKFIFLVTIFIAALVTAPILASKVTTMFGLVFVTGTFAYAITFPMTDVITEVWGKEKARKVVWAGFFALVVSTILIYFAILAPPAPFWKNQAAFESILSLVGRIVLGGFVAYLVAQHHDVWAFHFWKRIFKGRHLWLRNNASTIVSQFIDTWIFIIIGFLGVYSLSNLIPMIFGQFLIKMFIAAADTPVIYGLVKWVRS